MNDTDPSLKRRVLDKVRRLLPNYRSESPLRVAVLGPSLNESSGSGGEKRRQIYRALTEMGHSPFFPECELAGSPPTAFILAQEEQLLGSSDVQLVIILHTSGYGVAAELGNFARVPEIVSKTAVLFPAEFYHPANAVLANTAREFPVRMPYSREQFDACDLVSECLKWAEQRRSGTWPASDPHRF